MIETRTVEEYKTARRQFPLGAVVGFVPTMGYLHAGHVSLIAQAKRECQVVVCSIYVNPTQFGPNEDFAAYPRNLENDFKLLREAGCDIVFAPQNLYRPESSTFVQVMCCEETTESKKRPGHFRGVATVVTKLFNIVQPQFAYFGQKDAVQCVVIKRMVADLDMPLKIVVCPTMREADGLAMSSRNTYLNADQRKIAITLNKALRAAEAVFNSGNRSRDAIVNAAEELIRSTPGVSLDYISLASAETAGEVQGQVAVDCILSGAMHVGKTRLIDNLLLFLPKQLVLQHHAGLLGGRSLSGVAE